MGAIDGMEAFWGFLFFLPFGYCVFRSWVFSHGFLALRIKKSPVAKILCVFMLGFMSTNIYILSV